MADFYKEPNPTNDPNYLGMSKEPDRVQANTGLGKLFEGIGELGTQVVKFTDQRIKQGIMDDAHKAIDPIQAQHGSYMDPEDVRSIAGTGSKGRVRALQMKEGLSVTDDSADTGTGALGYAPEDAKRDFDQVNSIFPVNDKRPLPPQASREISQLQRLQQAYYAGSLSDSYYNAQLVSVAKQLRAQYPGYRDEVDQAISGITGVQPANALRASLMRDIQFNLQAQLQNQNSDQKFREKYRPVIAAGGYDPDNTPMETLRPYVNEQLGKEYNLKAQELRVNAGSPEAESLLSGKLSNVFTSGLTSMSNKTQGSKSLADFEAEARTLAEKGGGSPKEIADLVTRMELTKNSLKSMARQVALQPIEGDREGRNLVQKVKDGTTKLPQMIEASAKSWDDAIALIKSGQMSALQISTDSLKFETNLDVQNLRRAFPMSRSAIAINEAFPGNPMMANQFLMRSKILPEWGKAIENGLANAIIGGKSETPAPSPSEAVKAYGPDLNKSQASEIYQRTARQYDIVISPENKNTPNAKHVAQKFFTDFNYYDQLSDSGRMKLFLQMAAPSKTQFIKSLGPEVEADYKEWAQYAAGDIWRRNSDNVQAIMTDPRYKISFDLKSMSFTDETNYRDGNSWNISRQAGIEQRSVKEKLNAANNVITWLRPIVGDDPRQILPALGLNPLSIKEDQLGTIIMEAVTKGAFKAASGVKAGIENAGNVVSQGTKEAGEGLSTYRTWSDFFDKRVEPGNPR